jgi:hypothetical protein
LATMAARTVLKNARSDEVSFNCPLGVMPFVLRLDALPIANGKQ